VTAMDELMKMTGLRSIKRDVLREYRNQDWLRNNIDKFRKSFHARFEGNPVRFLA
jgi:hypothetical protein